MRKLLLLLLLCTPLFVNAQLSIVPSVTLGTSKFTRNTEGNYLFKTFSAKPSLMYSADVFLRYTTPIGIYTSAGLGYGYQASRLKANVDYLSHLAKDDANTDILSNLYVPIHLGFYIPNKKISPIAEVGIRLNTLLNSDQSNLYRYSDLKSYEVKGMLLSFTASAGIRYSLPKGSIELKAQYNVMQDLFKDVPNKYWSSIGANIAYIIDL